MSDDTRAAVVLPQTSPQLFGLLLRQARDDATLTRVRAAYAVAAEIGSGQLRASGKPLTCHLVGTAAALALAGADGDVIAAGLLHAVYSLGEWGDGTRRVTAAKRVALRTRVGAEVEALVARYTKTPWSSRGLPALEVARMSRPERDVLLMRLANEVDDHLDLGILYGSAANERRAESERALPDWLRLAEALAAGPLPVLLRATVEATFTASLPACLRTARRGTHMVASRGHRPRLRVALTRAAAARGMRLLHWAWGVRARLRSATGWRA